MLPTNTDPGNRKKEPCVQGVKPIIPKMSQNVLCVMDNISWIFHENPLIDITVMLLRNTPGAPRWETMKQSRQVWNNLANYILCRAWRFMKHHENPFTRFSKGLQKSRVQEIGKSTQDSRG